MHVAVTLPDALRVCLSALVPGWDLADVTDYTPLPGGYANDSYSLTYRGVRYVLRCVRPDLPGTIPRDVEYDLIAHRIAHLGAPLAAMSLPEGHLLTYHVPGPLLVDAAGVGAHDLATFVATLHARLPDFGWNHPLRELLRRWRDLAYAAGVGPDARVSRALDRLEERAMRSPCHNDLNPWNVVVRGGVPRHWCTLDWEWAGGNDPYFDVLTLCEGLALPQEAVAEVVARYAHARDLAPPPASVLADLRLRYFLREHLWARAALARRGPSVAIDAQIASSARALEALID
jgi:aminoglycoside phosphotransferase (APT) family kinase protein